MTLNELYEANNCKWSKIAKELKVTESTVQYWRKRGSIPYKTQLFIEDQTSRKYKAKKADDLLYKQE